MRNRKMLWLALLAACALPALSGCSQMDESFLDTEANYSVDIHVPYATATPLPAYLDVPDAIVIDPDGNVTLNDASIIEGDFQSARSQTERTEYRSLSLGSNGIAVQALQARLQELGYYDGEVTGLYDTQTESSVKRFEQTYGTMQTGVATQKLQLRLFASTAPVYLSSEYSQAVLAQYQVLRPGTVGSSVYALQQRLKNLNYPISDLTGAYDEQTAYCVQLFYQSYGLAASDVADVNMQRELYSETAHTYDPSIESMATAPPVSVLEGVVIPSDDGGEAEGDGSSIALGNSGLAVSQIQKRLIDLGYLNMNSGSGVFDEATQSAVNRFLQAIGRAPSGVLTQEMQRFLLSDQAPEFGGETGDQQYENLNPGDSGKAVLDLQRRLVQLGYASGTPNGQYGNATISAVQLYQQANGLDVDGLASAWLQSTLFSRNAKTYAQTQGLEDAEAAQDDPIASGYDADESGDALYFNLKLGETGNAVAVLRNRLQALGYAVTPGIAYDEQTQQAVMAFQNVIGVEATGEASASLQRYIRSRAAPGPGVRFFNNPQRFELLQPGDTGDQVTRLQRQLFSLGYLKQDKVRDSIGTYNDGTRQAVTDAQLAMGYDSADGVAGPEFQSFLFSKYAKKIKR
ncbi:MAG: peptidoglycan-binding protein [Clostridia bacterium]|nr:peptidoglycan-binding protein [Clostridia bacterium]